jgi:Uma2 family endonuclease
MKIDREQRLGFDPKRFSLLAPDLAVEILSPSNTMSEMQEKVIDYLDAGTRQVWVVDPGSRCKVSKLFGR